MPDQTRVFRGMKGNIFTRQLFHDVKVFFLVLAALCIVYLIFVPEHHNHRKAYEATLKGDLRDLRKAIEQFHEDIGIYPADLLDLTRQSANEVKAHIPKAKFNGPYLTIQGGIDNTGIPRNLFVKLRPFQQEDNDISHHWRYDPATGIVKSAVTDGVTLDGIKFSDL